MPNSYTLIESIEIFNRCCDAHITLSESTIPPDCSCDLCSQPVEENETNGSSLVFIRWPFNDCVIVGERMCTCDLYGLPYVKICFNCFFQLIKVYIVVWPEHHTADMLRIIRVSQEEVTRRYRPGNVVSIRQEIDEDLLDIASQHATSACTEAEGIAVAIPIRREAHIRNMGGVPLPDEDLLDTEAVWCGVCSRPTNKTLTVTDRYGKKIKICSSCYDSAAYLIFDYTYTPDELIYYKTEKDKRTTLYMGIELEVEITNQSKANPILSSLPEFIFPKNDSSIANGFEIVSHPATYEWLLENKKKWDSILNLHIMGCRSYNTNTCGMHIHLSKVAFDQWHLYKFLHFMYNPANVSFITHLSQRLTMENIKQWSAFDNSLTVIKEKAVQRIQVGDRHTAVSLCRRNTVELRIFKGTLYPEHFWKNIEFAHALYNFSKDYSKFNMIWAVFLDYIKTNKNYYPNLYKFLWGECVIDLSIY